MAASIWAPGTPANVTVNPTAPVEFLDGTAALPSITNTGDVDTGVHFPGANKVGISTDATNRVTVDELGNIIAETNKFVYNDEVDVASAATVEIGLAASNLVRITGSDNINSFGTTYWGPIHVRFELELILANSASLVLPSGANITVRAGDTCTLVPKATAGVPDGWVVTAYLRSDGTALTSTALGAWRSITSTIPVTLTSVNTIVKMQPTEYGCSVLMPDARTCAETLLYTIDCTASDFPVVVRNYGNSVIGFVYAGDSASISLGDNSTAAGDWSGVNLQLVGCSAYLPLTTTQTVVSVCQLDTSRDLILLSNGNTNVYAVVYNKVTNLFGSVTLVRTATISQLSCYALLVSADKVLVTSCTDGGTALEAVHLTITDLAIAVGTAGTAVLSAAFIAGAGGLNSAQGGCALIAAGNSSFSFLYQVSVSFWQIRAIDASTATPVISTATVLTGTSYGVQVAGDTGVVLTTAIVPSGAAYATAYAIAGSAAPTTAGAVSMGAVGAVALNKKLGRFSSGRFWSIFSAGNTYGTVISVAGTTCTISTATVLGGGYLASDAVAIGANKVLVSSADATTTANILTDTAAVASVGTLITVGAGSTGTAAISIVAGTMATLTQATLMCAIDCSGASPVASRHQVISASTVTDFSVSSATGIPFPSTLSTPTFAQRIGTYNSSVQGMLRLRSKVAQYITDRREYLSVGGSIPTGRAPNLPGEAWGVSVVASQINFLLKMECATV